jgi:hypothetical protein
MIGMHFFFFFSFYHCYGFFITVMDSETNFYPIFFFFFSSVKNFLDNMRC